MTAADVAEMAGVSKSTVSLIINGKAAGRIPPGTEERVRAAVEYLAYRVDQNARGLVTGRHESIALVVPDIGDPFASQLAMGVTEALRGRYRLVLVVAGPGPTHPSRLEDVLALGVDGVIVDSTSALQVRPIRKAPQPVVLLDALGSKAHQPRVDFDIAAGANDLADHLLAGGHRQFGYIDWVGRAPTFDLRRETLIARVLAVGLEPGRVHMTRSLVNVDSAAEAFEAAWTSWDKAGVSAVVCATDLQAYGVLREAAELGIDVPGRLSVAGFNDLEFSRLTNPPLTSVRLSGVDLGTTATELLLRLVEGGESEATRSITLPATLVARHSTGPALARR